MAQLAKAFCQALEDADEKKVVVKEMELPEDQKILPKFRSRRIDRHAHDGPPRSYIKIKELHLQMNEIMDPETVDKFKTGLAVSPLTYLNLSYNGLGDTSVRWLAQAIQPSHLRKLVLTQTKMSFRSARNVFRDIKHAVRLRELVLDNNQMEGSKLRQLHEMLAVNKHLEVLNLNNCGLGVQGMEWIATGLGYNKSLKTLLLKNNSFGDEGLNRLVYFMNQNEGFYFENLDISSNFISDVEGVPLAKALAACPRIDHINLADNNLGEPSAFEFLNLCQGHDTLTRLDLDGNVIPIKYREKIDAALAINAAKADPR